jgi:hypothetical protein
VPDLWSDLLGCLDPAADPDGVTFEGRNQQLEYHRVFGGQLLAQFIQIAALTCPDKAIKSQHAVFAREGRADEPIRYEATRNHEGRSFAALTITARQSRGVVATSSISMHATEDGPEHQEIENVPAVLGPEHEVALDLIPWETRAEIDLNATTTGPPQFEFWMRTPTVNPRLAPAFTAYATDLTLIADLSQRNSPELLFDLMGFGRPAGPFEQFRADYLRSSFGPSLQLVADAVGLPLDTVEASGELATASRETTIAAGTLRAGTVAAQRITIAGMRGGRPLLQFRATWYCTADLQPAWDVHDTGWHVSVDGDAPLEVELRMPIPLDRMAAVSPAYTANRAVNAVPYVCAAAPGIQSTLDLPQVITSLS